MGEGTLTGWRRSGWRVRLGAVVLFAAALSSVAKASGFGMTPEQFWHNPFGVNDWIPFVGDVEHIRDFGLEHSIPLVSK